MMIAKGWGRGKWGAAGPWVHTFSYKTKSPADPMYSVATTAISLQRVDIKLSRPTNTHTYTQQVSTRGDTTC